MKRDLTKEEQEEIQFAFDTLDADRTGQVTLKQLKVIRPLCSHGVGQVVEQRCRSLPALRAHDH